MDFSSEYKGSRYEAETMMFGKPCTSGLVATGFLYSAFSFLTVNKESSPITPHGTFTTQNGHLHVIYCFYR